MFVSHLTSNYAGPTFKIYPEFDHFSPFWSKTTILHLDFFNDLTNCLACSFSCEHDYVVSSSQIMSLLPCSELSSDFLSKVCPLHQLLLQSHFSPFFPSLLLWEHCPYSSSNAPGTCLLEGLFAGHSLCLIAPWYPHGLFSLFL